MKEYSCLIKVIHQIGRKRTVDPFSNFYCKICVAFLFSTGKCFVPEVSFESKSRNFKIPLFEKSACFYMSSTGKHFSKNWGTVFYLKVLRLKT